MSVIETLAKLPEVCYSVLPSDENQLIAIKRGEMGYFPIMLASVIRGTITAKEKAAQLNEGIATPEQIEAMKSGSMFGWDTKGADPDTWRDLRAKGAA